MGPVGDEGARLRDWPPRVYLARYGARRAGSGGRSSFRYLYERLRLASRVSEERGRAGARGHGVGGQRGPRPADGVVAVDADLLSCAAGRTGSEQVAETVRRRLGLPGHLSENESPLLHRELARRAARGASLGTRLRGAVLPGPRRRLRRLRRFVRRGRAAQGRARRAAGRRLRGPPRDEARRARRRPRLGAARSARRPFVVVGGLS